MKGIKKNDIVFITAGKDKGKSGKVLRVFADRGKVVVDGLNTVTRHIRPKRAGEKGGAVRVAMPIQASNVMLKCSKCGQATRRAFQILDNKSKVRVCKKCGAEV